MVNIAIKFTPTSSLAELRKFVEQDLKRRLRNNFADIRPFVADAINASVEATKDEFIPNQQETSELGVGSDGQPDTSRTEGAYKQMRTDNAERVTTFSVRKQRANALNNLIGTVTVTVDEKKLLRSELARVPTPDSEFIDEIPWLSWLIFGAPINTEYQFISRRPRASRTGGGVMVKGGIWTFPPARPGAFQILAQDMEIRLLGFIEENVGVLL